MTGNDELIRVFTEDLNRMPGWKAWGLRLSCGINIRRETGELIRMFRMLDEQFWNVYVFLTEKPGIRYRDKAHNKLNLKEAIMLTQDYIKKINEKENAAVLE